MMLSLPKSKPGNFLKKAGLELASTMSEKFVGKIPTPILACTRLNAIRNL
jgi:hypothetical protein